MSSRIAVAYLAALLAMVALDALWLCISRGYVRESPLEISRIEYGAERSRWIALVE